LSCKLSLPFRPFSPCTINPARPSPSKLALTCISLAPSLLFAITTFLSIYTLKYFDWNSTLPGYDGVVSRKQQPHDPSDPDVAAFSLAPHGDEEAYAPLGMNDRDHDDHDDHDAHSGVGAPSHIGSDPYGAPSPYEAPTAYGGASTSNLGTYGGANASSVSGYSGAGGSVVSSTGENPFRQENPFESDHEYHGAGAGRYNAPTAHELYDEEGRPAHFPSANYDRVDARRAL
jgi:hypothetical protein